jgi:drug/metabolite transporter (DMT)-like permease
MDDNRTPFVAIGLMLTAMCCIAIGDAFGKHLTQTYSVWQVLWVRSWVWLVVAVIWVSHHGGLESAIRSERVVLQAMRSLILIAEVAVFIFAFRSLPLGDVTAIGAATPLVVLVFSAAFLGEKVGMHRWIAVLVGFAGMLMVSRPGFGTFGWLTVLPISGVLLWGVYQVLLRMVSRHDREETTLLWTGCAMFVVTGLIAPWDWMSPENVETWTWMLLAGVFNTAGHFGLIAALNRGQASALQPFSYTAVLVALFIGWLAFNEKPEFWTIIGAIAIVAGGLYAMYRAR